MHGYKYFTIYETTNIINGKKYIGMHRTNNLDDNYFGSGKLLKRAIKKYGECSFIKKYLFVFDNEISMVEKERELITEAIINDGTYYNLKTGGEGGKLTAEIIELIRKKNIGRTVSKETIEKGVKTRIRNGNLHYGEKHHMYGKTHTDEVKSSISENLKLYYMNGNDVWNKGKKSKYSSETRKKKYGYNNGLIAVRDKDGNTFLTSVNDEKYLSGEYENITKNMVSVKDKHGNILSVNKNCPRYKSGELVGVSKGRKWIHNLDLKKRKSINPDEIDKYLNNGWHLGMGPKH